MNKHEAFIYLRSRIQFCTAYQDFKFVYLEEWESLSEDMQVGLKREWRAYWYLVKRFGNVMDIEMSSFIKDLNGTDIIGVKHIEHQKGHDAYVTFQVGGYKKDFNTHYYVMVTDKKIYLYKNKKGNNE